MKKITLMHDNIYRVHQNLLKNNPRAFPKYQDQNCCSKTTASQACLGADEIKRKIVRSKREHLLSLELRQFKNDSIQSKIIPILKLPRFFTTYTARGKGRQIQNWNHF